MLQLSYLFSFLIIKCKLEGMKEFKILLFNYESANKV